jgi:glutaminyl-tRNA synthetase
MAEVTNESDMINHEKLLARELPSAVNTPALMEEHNRINKGKTRTRFPPEPNGYLHVGHAKSMNMNFELAFEKLGVPKENRETIFRYDDTNPEAESNEYIQSLREDVAFMGWNPVRVTFTSDYFDELYNLAVELIKRGKAFVCHQSKADIEASRLIAKAKISDPNVPGTPNSPWRDRSVEDNLREFDNMRKGKYAANEATLRMKMDMTSPNPNMWDQVAYRIKYIPHPHAGDKWCIYPTYDYTHCIIDSLEHIDYSICTLEFETRRESYYWVLEALDLYRPKVYEMSRLNISYTVLSKRKLLKLVLNGYMRGWDDPRMPTIKGLRRRGYNKNILNSFCNEIGVTRNSNTVQYERLAAVARNYLHEISPRVMGILKPILIEIVNFEDIPTEKRLLTIPNYPFDAARGSHQLTVEKFGYIDSSDFRMEDDPSYYGLAPKKLVNLKYFGRVLCESYATHSTTGEVISLKCRYLPDSVLPEDKPKGTIQWIPKSAAIPVEVRLYNNLFTVEEPNDDTWEAELNPESEIVLPKALVDSSFVNYLSPESYVQFERIGYFIVDKDSVIDAKNVKNSKIVLNLTVNLKDSKPKESATASAGGSTNASAANRSRKEEQDRQLAEKMVINRLFSTFRF